MRHRLTAGSSACCCSGIKTMSEALQALAGDRLRRSDRPDRSTTAWRGIATGVRGQLDHPVVGGDHGDGGELRQRRPDAAVAGRQRSSSAPISGATIAGWLLALRLGATALALLGIGAWLNAVRRSDE